MNTRTTSVLEIEMEALDFREAAWQAEPNAKAPELDALSDGAIEALARYEEGDLPIDAQIAVRAEASRRSKEHRLTTILAWSALLGPGATALPMWEALALV